ncbi:MAG: hypothetical protein R3A13_06665 [Bdellovibrionota bacterium]
MIKSIYQFFIEASLCFVFGFAIAFFSLYQLAEAVDLGSDTLTEVTESNGV